MKGRRLSPGRSEYFSTISKAILLRGTTTVLAVSFIVFVGMYSTAPLMTSCFFRRSRSPTRQPTLHWNTKISLCSSNEGREEKSVNQIFCTSSRLRYIGEPYRSEGIVKPSKGNASMIFVLYAQLKNARSSLNTPLR